MKHNCFKTVLANIITWGTVGAIGAIFLFGPLYQMVTGSRTDLHIGLIIYSFYLIGGSLGWSVNYLDKQEKAQKRSLKRKKSK